MKKTCWCGNTQCDICHNNISKELYDTQTIFGHWATLCQSCYKKYGVKKLGLGFGQHYQFNNESKKFEKVEG